MNFRDFLKDNIVRLDGGMGTLLQAKGLKAGEHPERWNISHPDVVRDIHKAYFDAGSNVVCTNTFGANLLKFDKVELEEIISAAIENVKAAREQSCNPAPKFVALDIGPSGKLLKPLGDLDFEDAVSVFAETVKLGAKYGADLVIIETMNDIYETKAALLAARENCELPVLVSNVYGADGKLMTGASPEAMVAMLEGMGVDALGANCSLGPKQLRSVAEKLISCASVPVLLKPNAGLPKSVDGKTVFDVTPEEFAEEVASLVKSGLRIIGGCCGTTPEYISLLTQKTADLTPVPVQNKNITWVSSYSHAVRFDKAPVLIGERINPTGKKRFKQALINNDINYILGEGIAQQEKGVHILDVNVGLPDIDEGKMLCSAVCELQAIIDLPLQIDTADIMAMEGALRRYNGKAMINSVNGKKESMDAVFPLVKKYGGVVVALCLDESGIPETSSGRFAIAEKILEAAESYGINKQDIIFDTLAMTISADKNAALATLEALRRIKTELLCHTSLGVSNVSFGLPHRDAINSTFFAMALHSGLSAAIMNPNSVDMMRVYYAFKALSGMDENCAEYISAAETLTPVPSSAPSAPAKAKTPDEYKSELQRSIVKGLCDKAASICKELVKTVPPLDVVQNEIIPALNIMGEGFEKKTVYLPQLLMSAEAAKSAFEVVKVSLSTSQAKESSGVFVLATVKGDIHDIGKNIAKLLLENYGFEVVDLGKDVPPQTIVDAVISRHAPLCGLCALMTTTVPAMEETVALLRDSAPWCKVIVGGAVLTQEYSDKMGADKYARDAMEAVRYSQSVCDGK